MGNGSGVWRWVAGGLLAIMLGATADHFVMADKMPKAEAEKEHRRIEARQDKMETDTKDKLDEIARNQIRLLIRLGVDPVARNESAR